jgi:hypothetical protein
MRAFFELVRLPAVFTAPADVLAGLALGGFFAPRMLTTATEPAVVLALVAASVCIYAAGMMANDLFDRAIDQVERPGRPIPSGRIGVGVAWTSTLGLQVAGTALAFLGGGHRAGVACLATVLATYLYNGLLKSTLWGPLSMGLCRYGNAAIGLAALGLEPVGAPVAYAIPMGTMLYVAAVTGVSRHEVSGTPGPGLRWALVGMGGFALFPAVAALGGALTPWAGLAALAAPAFLARPLHRAWQGGAGPVRGAVMAGIFGIALVDAAIAVGADAPWTAGAIVALAAAGRRFGRWFYAT